MLAKMEAVLQVSSAQGTKAFQFRIISYKANVEEKIMTISMFQYLKLLEPCT